MAGEGAHAFDALAPPADGRDELEARIGGDRGNVLVLGDLPEADNGDLQGGHQLLTPAT
jgi:hypothetical protein